MHGSVTIENVSDLLAQQYDLLPADTIVTWMDRSDSAARMKTLDTWDAMVALRSESLKHRRIQVTAKRLSGKEEKPEVTAEH